MLGKFIAGDFIAIAGERRRFPASNLMIYLLIIPKTLYYLRKSRRFRLFHYDFNR